jgi:ABC-2 type transport system permease protein
MNKIFFIAKKEWATYFKSPIAYIVLVLTLCIFNVFFYLIIEQNREASLGNVFQVMEFIFVFLVPLLTMRLFSEEKSSGTMEFLMTAPISNTAIVLGKYFGILLLFSVMVAMTSVYYVIMEYFGQPDRLTTATGFLGIWLEGALFIAIGMMTSAWTRNQIVAAMSSYSILFFLYFSILFSQNLKGPVNTIIQQLSTMKHLENFITGIIHPADITYYLTGIVFCLLITRLSIENRLVE